MPITRNVAWDERLAAFKGRDTTDFVTLTAATATTCAACGLALQPEEQLSLIVDITEGTDSAGMEYLTIDTCTCHRRCQEPLLTVRQSTGGPEEFATLGARLILDQRARTWRRTIPALAYTVAPVLTFREPGGEPTSALVSVLLDHGFQLSMTSDYIEIIQHTRDVGPGVSCKVTGHRPTSLQVSLQICGEQMYTHGVDPADAGDAHWLHAAAREGKLLVISGDYLDITDAGLNLDAAAQLGTLATGNFPSCPEPAASQPLPTATGGVGTCSPPIDALVVPAQRAHDDCRGDPMPMMLRRRRVAENRRQSVGRFSQHVPAPLRNGALCYG